MSNYFTTGIEVFLGQYFIGTTIIVFNMVMISKGINPEVNYAMLGSILGYFLPSPSLIKRNITIDRTSGFPMVNRNIDHEINNLPV